MPEPQHPSPSDRSVDPDVDVHDPRQRQLARRHLVRLLLTIAAGGVIGAVARYEIGLALPHDSSQFPLATFLINATGCFAMGVLVVCLERFRPDQVYLRPFLGVGVLGGFTTFSTFAVDSAHLLTDHPGVALADYLGTPVVALVAVALGTALADLVVGHGGRRTEDAS